MENKELSAIILAGGKGTRMRSPLPKVVHPVAGRPMIERVIKACRSAQVNTLRLVVGHGQELVKKIVEPFNIGVFLQSQQLGTAHAVISANPETLEGDVLILNGDHPLVEGEDIQQFVKIFREEKATLGVVTAKVKHPRDFGRILRQKGELKAIIEAKEATAETLRINEINTGIYIVKANALKKYLPQIQNNNAKGEYYLTDLVSLCFENNEKAKYIYD